AKKMGLSFDEYRNLVSRFALETLRKKEVLFPAAELRELAKGSIQREAITSLNGLGKIEPDLFIRDLIENLCILQRDGLYVGFSHKSLQEYFAALYVVSKLSPEARVKFLDT